MVVTIELKKCVIGASILETIVSNSAIDKSCTQSFCFQLTKVQKYASIYHVILSFCLPVCLRVERGGELSLDTKEVIERVPELGYENHAAVTDNKVLEAMILYHHVNNYLS